MTTRVYVSAQLSGPHRQNDGQTARFRSNSPRLHRKKRITMGDEEALKEGMYLYRKCVGVFKRLHGTVGHYIEFVLCLVDR